MENGARERGLSNPVTKRPPAPVCRCSTRLAKAHESRRPPDDHPGCFSGTLRLSHDGRWKNGRRSPTPCAKRGRLGYTEPDPRDDLSGTDVARKATSSRPHPRAPP